MIWMAKKRVNVAPPTSSPPRRNRPQDRSGHGHASRGVGPDLGCKIGDLVPRQQVSTEAETQHQAQQNDAGKPREFPWRTIGVGEDHAEHVNKCGEDEKIRRPTVDGADQPPELDAGHDEPDAVKRLRHRGAIVEQQQGSRDKLYQKKEKRDPTEVIPPGGRVHRHGFVRQQIANRAEVDSFSEPVEHLSMAFHNDSRAGSRPAGDDHVFPAHEYRVFFERLWRRTGHHATGQVVHAVVARTPDLLGRLLVLYGAVQVGAHR